MKKVIVKHNGIEIGNAIIEDDKAQEMADIYKDNYKIFEPYEVIDENKNPTGVFVYPEHSVEVVDLSQDYDFLFAECIKNRIQEYPSPAEFMNVYFDGGSQAIEQLQQKRLEIKAKYPKPVKANQ